MDARSRGSLYDAADFSKLELDLRARGPLAASRGGNALVLWTEVDPADGDVTRWTSVPMF